MASWKDGHESQHPELHKMCVIDTTTMNRIIPNSEPMPLDNECFSGEVFLMVRTPDVDDAKSVKPSSEMAQSISTYMKGRLRRFEFQFRVKLKKVPSGPLFLGCDVETPIKVGRVTKGLTSVLLAMIKRINGGFHYSWGPEKGTSKADIESGNYEKTHLSFPVEASMDRIVISKPGDELPKLGQELMETPESVKRRRKLGAGCIDWNTEDTYTMCLWSAYMDWIKWKCLNVPGVRPFSLSVITGSQPVNLSVYEVKNISNEDYRKKKPQHKVNDVDIFCRLEYSHITKTEGGCSDKKLDHQQADAVNTDDEEPKDEKELFADPKLAEGELPAELNNGEEKE